MHLKIKKVIICTLFSSITIGGWAKQSAMFLHIDTGFKQSNVLTKQTPVRQITYVVDGRFEDALFNISAEDIAYVQVLDKDQTSLIFNQQTAYGVLYITTKLFKNSNINKDIQSRIDKLHPGAGIYIKPYEGRNSQSLTMAIQNAESKHWLILINSKEATLKELQSLDPNEIISISYTSEDSSAKYGIKAMQGVVVIMTRTK